MGENGSKGEEVAGGWRRLHNDELHNLYTSPNVFRLTKSRRLRREGHVARMGEVRNGYRFLVGKPEGKRPLGRSGRRWEYIRMDLREIGSEVVEWIYLAQDTEKLRTFVCTFGLQKIGDGGGIY
jgi:hypothetical protein